MPKFEVWVEEKHTKVWPGFITAADEDEALDLVNNSDWSKFATTDIEQIGDLDARLVERGAIPFLRERGNV